MLRKARAALAEGDILLVTRLDTLARSTRDLLNVLDAVAKAGASFKSLADAWANTTTAHGRLMLTEEEKAIVLRSVDMDRSSTLGLGTLTEGSSVPRGANVHAFSDKVVQEVPKLKGHKFFTAENRVAIVDTQGDKVQLVLEEKR